VDFSEDNEAANAELRITYTQNPQNPPLAHKITNWAHNKAGAVSITFDDGWTDNYTLAVPALNARGFKGTFLIVSSYAADMWDEWRDAASQGHEIGSHSKTHPRLPNLSIPEMEDEIEGSKAEIDTQITTQKCLSFAYPFGAFDDNVKSIAQANYITARGISCNYNSPESDFYSMKACEDQVSLAEMKAKADTAELEGKWLITLHHSLDGAGYGGWGIETFEEYLDYLKTKNLWVGTYIAVTKYIKEKESAQLLPVSSSDTQIVLNLTDTLDDAIYDEPLTIRSEVPSDWANVRIQQGNGAVTVPSVVEGTQTAVYFNAIPDRGLITLQKVL
jgi:peptidoglycan/xylan/chitin deacetylase (PgdA/CDA1 family)